MTTHNDIKNLIEAVISVIGGASIVFIILGILFGWL